MICGYGSRVDEQNAGLVTFVLLCLVNVNSGKLCILRFLNAGLIMRLVFESQDVEKFISLNFRRGLHMSLTFYLFKCVLYDSLRV